MSEWISQHPLLYDRSMVEYYKSTSQRDRLWFDNAVELGILEEDGTFISSKINPLYKWFLNIRTRLKRTKPSGSSGRSRLRERFLQSKFGFILAADAAAVGGHQERQERQPISYKKKLATPSTSQQQAREGEVHDTVATAENSALDDLEVADDILESLQMESTVPAASTTLPRTSNTALSQMIRQNRQLSSQISNLLDQHTQAQSGSGVRAAAGATFAASLMTEVHPSLQIAMQQHVLHTVFQYIRRTDEILGHPQEQPPYQYLQESTGFFPTPLLHQHIDNPYQMQQHFSMGAPQMSSQQVAGPSQMSSQQMTAPHQIPPQMSSQQMTAPPQMSSQQMTAPPQMSSQQMTAPPQMSSQQMTALTPPTYTTLQNAPSFTSRSSSGAGTSSGFWGQAIGPPTPTTLVRATTGTSPGSNVSTSQNVSTPEPPPLCSPATIDALEGMLQ